MNLKRSNFESDLTSIFSPQHNQF